MPSVPRNGTPTLTVNREIIQALMGYALRYCCCHRVYCTCFLIVFLTLIQPFGYPAASV